MPRDYDIIGAGGGGDDSSQKATEAPDTLQSIAYAKILDLLSEGEVEGPMDDDIRKSILLNNTPIMNPDGSLNFTDVTIDYRPGTQDQTYMAGFPAVENELSVSVQVHAGTPLVRTINNQSVNRVRILVSTPTLVQQTDNGSLEGSAIDVSLFVQSNGAGFQPAIHDIIEGKTRNKYQRQYGIELHGSAPWDIKVVRNTPDTTSARLQNDLFWDSYTEVIDGKFKYPNSAYLGLVFNSQTFNNIPTRSFRWRGVKVKIPVNYDPIARTYSGMWNGNFKTEWTNNPAWIFYDLVTTTRYGLGNYVDPALVDQWTLYSIAQYCDQYVPDGFGGTEPRFTCNLYLQQQAEAFKVINNLASIFRAMVYWGAGLVTVSQDSPKDPEFQYTDANVIDGRFTYAGSARLARHTVANVTWNDPSDQYKQKVEFVDEIEQGIIDRYGIRELQVDAIGCTSRGQAHRFGKWALFSEALETEVVTFRSSLESTFAYPGAVIQILDQNRAGLRVGGRVVAATTTQVTLDAPVTIVGSETYTLHCVMPDGTVEAQPVFAADGQQTVLQAATPFSAAPGVQSIWVLASSSLVPKQYRIINITRPEKHLFEIMALEYNGSKFAFIENNIPLQIPPTSIRTKNTPAPTNVTIAPHDYTTQEVGVKLALEISWQRPAQGLHYFVEYKRDSNNWIKVPGYTQDATVDIYDLVPGVYTARVVAFNALEQASLPAYSTPYSFVGKTDVPGGLANLRAEAGLWEIDLFWDFAPNQGNVLETEIWVSATNDRGAANILGTKGYPADTAIETDLDNGVTHYYWGRTKSTSGIYSDWFPVSPLAGIKGMTINDNTKIITMLSGAINGSYAGLSLKDQLDTLFFPGTGISSQVVALQSQYTSLYNTISNIGARLDPPNGDIATAISRIQSLSAVRLPTPLQSTAPSSPIIGDDWYDLSSGGALRYYNGTSWILASSAIAQATDPAVPTPPPSGTLWLDTSTPTLYYKIWTGTGWIYAARATIYAPSQPSTHGRAIADTWKDTVSGDLWVFDGNIWVDTQNANVAAIASQVTALQTTVGNHTAQIQQNITSIGGVTALYSLKIDNNGHVAGFALSSTLLANGTAISDFVVDATRFAVGDPSISGIRPFIVTNGQVYIQSAFIVDAAIDTLKLAGNAVTIPVAAYVPGVMGLSPSQQSVVSATVNFPVAPALVSVIFVASVANGGGANGATQTFVYRDGGLVYSGQDGIVNNVYSNRAIAVFTDNPGPGTHTYDVLCNYAGSISSASIQSRSLIITGSLR